MQQIILVNSNLIESVKIDIIIPELTSQSVWVHKNCARAAASVQAPLSRRCCRHRRGVLPHSSLWSSLTPALTSCVTRERLAEVGLEVSRRWSGPWPVLLLTLVTSHSSHRSLTRENWGWEHVTRYRSRGLVRLEASSFTPFIFCSSWSLVQPRQCSNRVLTEPSTTFNV